MLYGEGAAKMKQRWQTLDETSMLKRIKQTFIFVIGTTILAVGIFLIVLPGPAIIIIPLGLAILSSEFFWAKQILKKVKSKMVGKIK